MKRNPEKNLEAPSQVERWQTSGSQNGIGQGSQAIGKKNPKFAAVIVDQEKIRKCITRWNRI